MFSSSLAAPMRLRKEKQKSNAYRNWQIIPINQTQTIKMIIRKMTTRITTKTKIHQRRIRTIIRALEQQPVRQPIKVLRAEAPIRQQELRQEVRHRQVANREQTAV